MTGIASEDILRFWFEALEPKQWWSKDAALDALIAECYAPLLASAIVTDDGLPPATVSKILEVYLEDDESGN